MLQLTPQQQAVVNHTYGPALVFAVAGAGKTTALEQRIVRLVQEGIFAPQRILAAAYNTAVKEELGARLRRHRGCEQVEVVTLHALGLRAVRLAWEAGLLPHLQRSAFQQIEDAQDAILLAALAEARRRKVSYLRDLDNLDRTDFFTWLSHCQGNLFYPDLASLPAVLRQSKHAQQASAPPQTPWYLPFSQLMAEVQQARGLFTFDDQLRVGWEVLVSYPAIRKQLQQRYDCVLVDEFQDVNLAQFLILDMITEPHRNYMVVGDDDQTIYEWRGANPTFILNFAQAYNAATYVISENFRCPAGPLTLANWVIRANRQRYPKSLKLTQGFGGTTLITRSANRRQMGQAIVETIRTLLQKGDRIQDMVVLVRAKAQTPPVELALIQAQIPYAVVGSEPFYARWEVATLIAYCRLALFEQQLQKGKRLSPAEAAQLVDNWEMIYRHPKRYISQQEARQISVELGKGYTPITQTLRRVVISDKPYVQTRLAELATLLQWLSGAFASNKSAHSVLQELERKLGYCAYLEQRGTRSEAGVDEAENVRQFIEEAKDRGSLMDYLVYLKRLSEQQAAQQQAAGRDLLTIRTIHSAKGLEWKVVILPSCDDGNMPHRKSDNVEEERRLLYVALTRSRRDLYIYYLASQPSPFLSQAKWHTVLRAVAAIGRALEKPPAAWSDEEMRAVAIAAPQLGLLDYFRQWHKWRNGDHTTLAQASLAHLQHALAECSQRHERKVLQEVSEQWSAFVAGEANPQHERGLDVNGVRAATQRRKPALKASSTPATPRSSTNGHSAAKMSQTNKARQGPMWQTFDEVFHPDYGRGIIVSTTTTTRGRELKVQFVDGTLVHFADSDPALAKE